MDAEKIGKFIAKLRMEKGYTQNDLAKKINVTNKAVSKWERGLGFPDITLLEPLSTELNISILELLKGEFINEQKNEKSDDINVLINYFIEIREHYNFKKLIITSSIFFIIYFLIFIVYFKSRFHGLETIDLILMKDRINIIPFANFYSSSISNNYIILIKNIIINIFLAIGVSTYIIQFINNLKAFYRFSIIFNIIVEFIKFISLIGIFDINDILIRILVCFVFINFIKKYKKKG